VLSEDGFCSSFENYVLIDKNVEESVVKKSSDVKPSFKVYEA